MTLLTPLSGKLPTNAARLTPCRRCDMLVSMTHRLPEWALTAGRPDAEKIIKYVTRYGYAKEVDDEFYIEPKLFEDYPAVFILLGNYMISQMSDKYGDLIDKGKVHGYRDDDGKLQYRMDDDVE